MPCFTHTVFATPVVPAMEAIISAWYESRRSVVRYIRTGVSNWQVQTSSAQWRTRTMIISCHMPLTVLRASTMSPQLPPLGKLWAPVGAPGWSGYLRDYSCPGSQETTPVSVPRLCLGSPQNLCMDTYIGFQPITKGTTELIVICVYFNSWLLTR